MVYMAPLCGCTVQPFHLTIVQLPTGRLPPRTAQAFQEVPKAWFGRVVVQHPEQAVLLQR